MGVLLFMIGICDEEVWMMKEGDCVGGIEVVGYVDDIVVLILGF